MHEHALERAAAAVAAGRLDAAAEILHAALEAAPREGRLLLELGVVEKLRGRIAQAFDYLGQALERLPESDGPGRLKARFVLGLTWGDVGQPERAVRSFDSAASVASAKLEHVDAAAYYAQAYRDMHGL